jgi:prolyl-tRNA editing enzyme YbaK/EbsC (Cys-tRNA(Pro) deacylase)
VRPHRGSPDNHVAESARQSLGGAVDRVTAVLRDAGVEAEVREFPEGTRTAQEAAAAVGCAVGQICKSLVFRVGDEPLLVVASGSNRVDEARFGAAKADARWVRERTGFERGPTHPACPPSATTARSTP